MLDPELRSSLSQQSFYGRARGGSLGGIEFGRRNAIELALFGIVIEVAAEHDRPGLCQLQKQHLMIRRMSGCRFDDHRSITKNVVIGAAYDGGAAVLQGAVNWLVRCAAMEDRRT